VDREVIKENVKDKVVMRDRIVEKPVVKTVDKKVLVDKIVEVAMGENVVEKSKIVEVPTDKMSVKVPRYEEEATYKTVYKDRIVEKPTERVVYDERLVEVPVDKPVDRMVEVIREVNREVVVHQDKIVEVPRELRVERVTEKIVPREVRVPVTLVHETIKEVPGPERVVNVIHEKCVAVERKVPFEVIQEYAEAQVRAQCVRARVRAWFGLSVRACVLGEGGGVGPGSSEEYADRGGRAARRCKRPR
jgi:hypothetical protein